MENIEAMLCAYIEGDLDESGSAQIEKHLESNPHHRKLLNELMELREMGEGLAAGEGSRWMWVIRCVRRLKGRCYWRTRGRWRRWGGRRIGGRNTLRSRRWFCWYLRCVS